MNNVFFLLIFPSSVINAEKQEAAFAERDKQRSWLATDGHVLFTRGNKLAWQAARVRAHTHTRTQSCVQETIIFTQSHGACMCTMQG